MIVSIAFAIGQLQHPIDISGVDKYAILGVVALWPKHNDQEMLTLETDWPLVPEVRALMNSVAAMCDIKVGELDPEDIIDGPADGSKWWWTAEEVFESVRKGEITEIDEYPSRPPFTFADGAWKSLRESADLLTALLTRHGANIAGMMAEIGEYEFPEGQVSMRFCSYSHVFVIECHGPVEVLNTVCRIVRQRGFDWPRDDVSKEKEEYVSLFLYEEGKVRMSQMVGTINFSSTICHRVKVGTKFVEVDDYQVVCK